MAQMLREIRRSLTYWRKIKNPPNWVKKATDRYEMSYMKKYRQSPYDKVTYFTGKNWLYKAYFETIEQGRYVAHYYKKKRIK
jgi:hypothetical protein